MALTIAIGGDHAGYEYKAQLMEHLQAAGHELVNYGTDGPDSVDYPDFAHPVADAVESGKAQFGVLVCGSGQGVAITANKHQGIRAALCWEESLAALAREHNNANVICLPARFVSIELAMKMADTFLATAFEGGRHERRVGKISC